MAFSWEEIQAVIEHRRSADGALKRQMIEVRDRYNGDYVIPLPSVKGQPDMAPMMPNLVVDGIDGVAMRAASTRPVALFPAVDQAKERGVRSREYANIRRRAVYSVWHETQLDIKLRRVFRHYAGYGEIALVAVPDFRRKTVSIEVRDPLTAYPETRSPEDVRMPDNVGFVFGRTATWIRRQYPEAAHLIDDYAGYQDDLWDMVEWIDEDHIVIGLVGPRNPPYASEYRVREGEYSIELRRWPNRAGCVPVACSRAVKLDRIMGQITPVLGTIDYANQLMALDTLAAEKAIFPDRYIIGSQGRPPQLLSGEWKDGRTGSVNVVTDVENIGELQSSPGPLTHPVIDRLESAVRQTGGINPLMSGMSPGSSLRTGRAIDSMGAFAIEPRIQEAQEVVARGLGFINKGIVEIFKGYWPRKKYVVFSGWPADLGQVEFTPDDHFETGDNVVSYNLPGMDANMASVQIGQMVGGGMMSRRTGMVKHPNVDDPDSEERLINEERIEDAIMAAIQEGASSQAIPIADLAYIKKLLKEGHPVEAAVQMADERAKARQTTPAPEAPEGTIAAPETAPGLAPPGVGAEQPPPEAIAPPEQSLQNFQQIIQALRGS